MTLLDENVSVAERINLETAGVRTMQVGVDWGRKTMPDEEILARLHRTRLCTFFSSDKGLYRRELCHPSYCLAVVEGPPDKLAKYAMRFLRHRDFRTHALRMGKIAALRHTGIVYWTRNAARERTLAWS